MKRLIIFTLLFTSQLLAQDYWCLNKRVKISADYGYIRRQEVRNLPLVKRSPTNKTVVRTEDLEKRLGWESAIRGGLIYHADACTSWEAVYTYFYPWKASKNVFGDDDLFFPFKDPAFAEDYIMADRVNTKYETRLQNGEFNYWGHITPQRVNYFSFSWNLGFRMMYLREKLRLVFHKDLNISPYRIDAFNTLYGAQLGAMLEINPTCCWTWTFIVKGAAFLNDAKNEVEILDENATVEVREYEKQRWADSYLLEGYGQLAYHMSSWFSVHFGYQGYILTGVATVPNQKDDHYTEHRRINTKGQIVIDGLYAGLDLSF